MTRLPVRRSEAGHRGTGFALAAVVFGWLLSPALVAAQVPPAYAPPAIPRASADTANWSRSPAPEGWGLGSPSLPLDGMVVDAEGPVVVVPKCEFLPLQLLWQPPLASLRQPRLFVITDDLDNEFTRQTIDTAIGGTVGLFRFHSEATPCVEFQIDFFGVNFARWSERHLAVASDYRYGFPVTFRSGPWQGKLGYEHTSTHLGDDFIKDFGRFKVQYVRDEIVFGLSYRWWDQLRLYGEFGYAAYIGTPFGKGRERFDWGIEWSRQRPTGWKGQPFAAFDMDLRPEQDYQPNISLQLGWQWIPDNRRLSGRLAFQYYNGNSPYGQFLLDKERFYGFGVFVDF